MTTPKSIVCGHIKAMGPLLLQELINEVLMQCDVKSHYHAHEVVVEALNELMREGVIELYDTGDAWTMR